MTSSVSAGYPAIDGPMDENGLRITSGWDDVGPDTALLLDVHVAANDVLASVRACSAMPSRCAALPLRPSKASSLRLFGIPSHRRLGNVGTNLRRRKAAFSSFPAAICPVGSLLLATYYQAPVTGSPHKTGPSLPYTMAHPYSGAAGYIHASEYPYTPVKAQRTLYPLQSANGDDVESEIDPYGVGVEQYRPIHSFNPSNTIWSAQDSDLDLVLSYTHNLTVLSEDADDQDSVLSPMSRGTFGAINPPGAIPSRPLRPLPRVPSQQQPYHLCSTNCLKGQEKLPTALLAHLAMAAMSKPVGGRWQGCREGEQRA
ncbi:hypothetical protein HMN09_00576200 [Mycena chlorophos]|uniref:Uncharacterized protein n=1 Tax=Mycena chlorophos TaxID=658473 RepID=A0A8H6WJ40_MYCCL|nr:hypothetical protein HMN09_00576200 [Mycena chlorophos]